MSKKVSVTIAPLQRVIAETITDPRERAALDRVRALRRQRERKKTAGKGGTRTAAKKKH